MQLNSNATTPARALTRETWRVMKGASSSHRQAPFPTVRSSSVSSRHLSIGLWQLCSSDPTRIDLQVHIIRLVNLGLSFREGCTYFIDFSKMTSVCLSQGGKQSAVSSPYVNSFGRVALRLDAKAQLSTATSGPRANIALSKVSAATAIPCHRWNVWPEHPLW